MKTLLLFFFLFAFWLQYVLEYSFGSVKGFSITNLATYMLFIAWVLSARKYNKFIGRNNLNVPILVFVFIGITSILVKTIHAEVSVNLIDEVVYFKGWVTPFIIFLIVFNVIEDKRSCKFALIGLILLLAATLFSTVLVGYDWVQLHSVGIFKGGRIAGLGDPNQYACYLSLFLPLAIGLILFIPSRFVRIFGAILTLVTVIGIILAASRGGVLALLIGLTVYFIIICRWKSPHMIAGVSLLSICFAVVAFFMAPSELRETAIDRMDPTISRDLYEYTSGRTEIFHNGFMLFLESPIYGHGQNTFGLLNNKRLGMKLSSHNDYLKVLVEQGLMGLIVFCCLFYKVFVCVVRIATKAKNPLDKCIYAGYAAGFFVYLAGMMSVNMYEPQPIFWFYTAVVYKYSLLSHYLESTAGERSLRTIGNHTQSTFS